MRTSKPTPCQIRATAKWDNAILNGKYLSYVQHVPSAETKMLEVESGTVSSGKEPSMVKVASLLPVKIGMAQTKLDVHMQNTRCWNKSSEGMEEPFNKWGYYFIIINNNNYYLPSKVIKRDSSSLFSTPSVCNVRRHDTKWMSHRCGINLSDLMIVWGAQLLCPRGHFVNVQPTHNLVTYQNI